MIFRHTQYRGFTLIEMIIVIVLLAIIASVSTRFFSNTIIGYNEAAQRTELSQMARIAAEKIIREVRNALPHSIRISNNCIEFIPIISSAHYQDQNLTYSSPLVTSRPLAVTGQAVASNQVDVFNLNFTPQAGRSYYLAVYPIGAGSGTGDPYAATNPGPLANFQSQSFVNPPSNSISRLTLAASYLFLRHSPQRRLFVVSTPISYCIITNRLQRYSNYGLSISQATPPTGTVQRIAQDVQLSDAGNAVIPFIFNPGSLVRHALVKLDFRFRVVDYLSNANWIRINHEVQIRNVL